MKYGDVVEIPAPLETVKQVRDSDTVEVARGDVEGKARAYEVYGYAFLARKPS